MKSGTSFIRHKTKHNKFKNFSFLR